MQSDLLASRGARAGSYPAPRRQSHCIDALQPDLRLLRYFVAVAEKLSFTRAAAGQFIAQPSLSAAIRQLEAQLGVLLFERDSRHVALTPAGAAMLPHAREALAAAERGVRAAQATAAGHLEVLRVLYTQRLEPVALGALDRLEASDPAVSITARGVWAEELVRELREGRADVGIVRFPLDSEGLEVRALRGDPVCALIGESRAEAHTRQPAFLPDLADHPLLTLAPELGFPQYNAFVVDTCGAAGLHPETLTVGRLDDSGWWRVVDGRAFALIGGSERAPGGTVKVALTDAPRMPLLIIGRPGSPHVLIDALSDAVQHSADALS